MKHFDKHLSFKQIWLPSRAERRHSRPSLVTCSTRESCTTLVRLAREALIPSLAIVRLAREQSLFVLGHVRVFTNCSRIMCVMRFFAAHFFRHSESSI